MEKIVRPLSLLLITLIWLLLLSTCEYMGFDGYINQLDEIGINSNLADAVSFNQHLASRPREFQGKVYVLGTRGVFEMDADNLSDYTFYAYSQDLGYWEDYWQDELPPINCYVHSLTGEFLIESQNTGNGIGYSNTVKLNKSAGTAVVLESSTYTSAWGPVARLIDSSSNMYKIVMSIDYFGSSFTTTYLYDDTNTDTGSTSAVAGSGMYIITDSFISKNNASYAYCAIQTGYAAAGTNPLILDVYAFDYLSGSYQNTYHGGIVTQELFEQNYMAGFSPYYYINTDFRVSLNDQYMLIRMPDVQENTTMVIYDYISGERKLETDIPGNNQFPELGESGMTVWVTSIRGGVARYEYD